MYGKNREDAKIRYMRILLFFDLPTESGEDRRNYSIFRKKLIKQGFLMIQESVYCKCVNVQTKVEREYEKIKNISPPYGNVRCLAVTEQQWQRVKIFTGNKSFVEEINDNLKHIVL